MLRSAEGNGMPAIHTLHGLQARVEEAILRTLPLCAARWSPATTLECHFAGGALHCWWCGSMAWQHTMQLSTRIRVWRMEDGQPFEMGPKEVKQKVAMSVHAP